MHMASRKSGTDLISVMSHLFVNQKKPLPCPPFITRARSREYANYAINYALLEFLSWTLHIYSEGRVLPTTEFFSEVALTSDSAAILAARRQLVEALRADCLAVYSLYRSCT